MTITDDKIIFDTADFDGLSDFGKKAVSSYLGDYAAYLSSKVNEEVRRSKGYLKSLTISDPVTDSILSGLASASDDKLKEAEPLLAQLDELLNPK